MLENQDNLDHLETAMTFREEGERLARQGKFEEAMDKYKKATELNPYDSIALRNWGLTLLSLNKAEESLDKFQKAIEINSNDTIALNGWGLSLSNLKRYKEALDKCKRAIEIDPYYADAYDNCFNILYKLGQSNEANDLRCKQYRIAVEHNPDDAEAHKNWAFILSKIGMIEEAKEKYKRSYEIKCEQCRRATESNPNDSITYRNWGLALIELRQYDEAAEKLEKAAELDHGDALTYRYWGFALMARNDYEEALDKFQRATEVDPNDVIVYRNWGGTLFSLKRYEEAADKFNKAIELDDSDALTFHHLGITLVHLIQYEEAKDKFETALKKNEDFYAPMQNIALMLMRMGLYPEAWEAWEKTRKVFARALAKSTEFTRDPDFYRYYGETLHEIFGEFAEAEEIFDKGLQLDPENIGILTGLTSLYIAWRDENSGKEEIPNERAHCHWKARQKYHQARQLLHEKINQSKEFSDLLSMGELLVKMEEYGDAEDYLKEALKDDAEDWEIARVHENLGVLYIRKDFFKKAVKSFQESIRLNPENLTVRNNLAEALHKAGHWEKAKELYKQILRETDGHVEANLGLGEVYTSMGDAGDPEMYDRSVKYFTQGLRLSRTGKGSKRLKPREEAAARYSRGYARVKLYEAAKFMPDETHLNLALHDFKQCVNLNLDHDKARQAKEKIVQALRQLTPQKMVEKYGPYGVIFLSLVVFGIGQYTFFTGKPCTLSPGYYAAFSFGSILFLVAGLYLPQILKLKVGGLELEKSAMSQVTSPTSLNIPK